MPDRTETFVVEGTLPQERLDAFLHKKFPEASRGTLQRLIEEGQVRVNSKETKSSYRPRNGETLTVCWPEARPAEAQPEKMSLSILFEDEDLVVVNKPAGLVVHPAVGHEEHTLVNALLHHCAGQLSGIGGVARPGIVHRIDKETSGCLVVAKNDATHVALAEQFAGREVTKIYHAVLCGALPKESGEIDAPIARHPTQRKIMAVVPKGRESKTSYRILKRMNSATLVEATLHSGRTHQIRVHFKYLGFPLVGDVVYGKQQNLRLKEVTRIAAGRQMLHAYQLSFTHPRTKLRINCEAPFPEDFQATVASLSK